MATATATASGRGHRSDLVRLVKMVVNENRGKSRREIKRLVQRRLANLDAAKVAGNPWSTR